MRWRRRLLARRNDEGFWGAPDDLFKWWPKKDTTFWVLGVLADFGLTREDSGIDRACEYVFSTQLPSGAFGLRPPPIWQGAVDPLHSFATPMP